MRVPELNKLPPADASLVPFAGLPLQPPAEEDLQRNGTETVASNDLNAPPQMLPPEAVHPLNLIKPEPLHLVPLGEPQTY